MGGLAGVLLDTLNQTNWKTELMQNASLSPIEILAKLFDDEITSQDIVVTDDLIDTYKELSEQGNNLDETQIENIVTMFKKMKEENVDAYNEFIKQFQTENPELMEKILPLLE
jgi:hypoxanthine-guanine phosphoribosyltransferase